MKRKILTGLTLTLTVGLLLLLSSCNSGSKSKTDAAVSVQKSTGEIIQGVFEYVAPYQGYFILLDDHYLFLYGTTGGQMFCHGGHHEVSDGIVTSTSVFSTNPENVGNSTKWKAELSGDTLTAIVVDDSGNDVRTVKGVRKVEVNQELKDQMKDFEDFFQYTAPFKGQAVMLGGYYIYLAGTSDSTMTSNGGTYTYEGNIITCTQEYLTTPESALGEFRWQDKSETRDTLHWALLDANNEVISSGKNVRLE